jgi:NTP pyrophosphatase (non-canonical NTP hydrolase)
MQNQLADISAYKESIYAFNNLSGQANKVAHKDIYNQVKLIEEETKELLEAIEAEDIVEVVDAVGDILFVVLGLQQKLENLGINVDEACKRIAENNLSKFPAYDSIAETTVTTYENMGVKCTKEFNEEYQRWVIKDTNSKVRKPVGYVSVNIEDCIPDKLLKEGLE